MTMKQVLIAALLLPTTGFAYDLQVAVSSCQESKKGIQAITRYVGQFSAAETTLSSDGLFSVEPKVEEMSNGRVKIDVKVTNLQTGLTDSNSLNFDSSAIADNSILIVGSDSCDKGAQTQLAYPKVQIVLKK